MFLLYKIDNSLHCCIGIEDDLYFVLVVNASYDYVLYGNVSIVGENNCCCS